MASVTFTEVWLHDAADYADSIQLGVRSLQATPERQVSRRVYAAGRVRAVSRPAVLRTVEFEAVGVVRADLDWLDGMIGETLMFRGPRGRVLFGFIAQIPTPELIWTDLPDLRLTFQAVTASAEV